MKETLRREIGKRKRCTDLESRRRDACLIQHIVLQLPVIQSADWVATYMAMPDEVETVRIRDFVFAAGKRLAVPRFFPEKGQYRMVEVRSETEFAVGVDGALEPAIAMGQRPNVVDHLIEVALVPGVAFDSRGNRLGRGGGHMDRLLANMDALKIGLCFDWQLVPNVPVEPHDIAMDAVISTEGVAQQGNSRIPVANDWPLCENF